MNVVDGVSRSQKKQQIYFFHVTIISSIACELECIYRSSRFYCKPDMTSS